MPKATLSDYIGNVRRFENNPAKAGQRVRRNGYLFGYDGGSGTRFCLFATHTRFSGFEWFVQDAESADPETGLPLVIAQAADGRTAYMRALETARP